MRGARWVLTLAAVAVWMAAPHAAIGLQQDAGSLAGPWTGEIRVSGITLKMRVVFSSGADGLAASIDIPQQGAAGIPLRNVRAEGAGVYFELPAGPGVAVFDGTRDGDQIEGAFTQGPAAGTFVLARGETPPEAEAVVDDLPYRSEDVTFGHGDIRLAGTITTPEGAGPFPAVVLISGSGAQTRDEDVLGFKVFGTLADSLTRDGVAVLRYDDRGVGDSSGPADGTTDDFANDVVAAVGVLKDRPGIAMDRIGLIGHSEGALVAAIAAGQSSDIGFVVLMAGPAVAGEQIVRGQAEAILRASGGGDAQVEALRAQQDRLFQAVRSGEGWDEIEARSRADGRAQLAALPEAQRAALGDADAYLDGVIRQQLAGAQSDWYRFFVDYDPAPALSRLNVPVLAVFGEKDLQVLLEQNRPAFEQLMADAGHDQATARTYAGANHLFQEAVTGLPGEYGALPKAFVTGFAADLAAWIQSLGR